MSSRNSKTSKVVKYKSGYVRGSTKDKVDYSLAYDGPMFERLAEHLTKQAQAHGGKRNWMEADSQEEYDRNRESAFRHFIQWYRGDTDEDHAAAVYFNINGAERLRGKYGKNS